MDHKTNTVLKTDIYNTGILDYQYDILNKLGAILTGKIRVPAVFDLKVNSEATLLKLEYVSGQTIHHILRSGELMKAKKIIEDLWSEWSDLLTSTAWSDLKVRHLPTYNLDYRLRRIIDAAESFNIRYDPRFEQSLTYVYSICAVKNKSFCHGDFTIDNIIVKDNYFFLIDLIPSPFSCLEQDLSKLVQDGVAGWAFRGLAGDSINNELFLIIDALILDLKRSGDVDLDLVKKLSFFNLLRILPYIKRENVEHWLDCLDRLRLYFFKEAF